MTPLTYICETPMLKLVEAKGQSWGLNTELLNGKNCHVTGFPAGFPVGISDPRSFVVLALDRFVRDSNSQYKFPRLDLAHATTHFEEHILRSSSQCRCSIVRQSEFGITDG